MSNDIYLGDGVYASFDGYHVWLDLRCQNASRIALDPTVLNSLWLYARKCFAPEGPPECHGSDKPQTLN